MLLEPSQDPAAADPLVSAPPRVPTPLVLAGVAGACLLGAGLGLWARPSELERRSAHPPRVAPAAPAPATLRRRIEIRVDGAVPPTPPKLAAAVPAAPAAAAAPPPAHAEAAPGPELLAPRPPPEGLMRVHAVAPPRLTDAAQPSPRLPRPADLAAKAAAERQAAAQAKLAKTKARRAAAAEAHQKEAHDKALAKVAAKRAAERRLADQAAATHARNARLADAKAQKARAAGRLAEDRRRTAARPAAPSPGPTTRVAAAARPRCASPDPGAALACADPSLNAADRQLSRAYRQAQAAGVPEERLQRQQQRWLAARANAARQAPWAVHDIYLARIAELQDQTRAAGEGE